MKYGDLDRYVHTVFKAHDNLESMSADAWVYTRKRLYMQPRIRILSRFRPTGLAVRYYCLLGILFVGEKDYSNQIHRLVSVLSCGYSIWIEGYTLWRKTKKFISAWLSNCDPEPMMATCIGNIVKNIDHNFINTAYRRNGSWYPAPFGYVVDEPLERRFQSQGPVEQQNSSVSAGPVRKDIGPTTISYVISATNNTGNKWIPTADVSVRVINGYPYGFRYQPPQQNGDNQTEFGVGE